MGLLMNLKSAEAGLGGLDVLDLGLLICLKVMG